MFDTVSLNLKGKSDEELVELLEELNNKTMIAPPHLRTLITINLNLVLNEIQLRKETKTVDK